MDNRIGEHSLSTLTAWSMEHIRAVFEAPSDEESSAAVDATFSSHISATINGKSISREDIRQLVLAMRKSSRDGLKVHWRHAVDAPSDSSTCRGGSFGGVYTICGIYKEVPGHPAPVEFERHKTVTVRIESQNSNPGIDSRKIVELVFVASDVRRDQPNL